ncbi:MAG: AMP phosphorylase [Thermoplasmatales archaeon]|nr:AMP phosphorylase [Thermoplasmatales archaeon]
MKLKVKIYDVDSPEPSVVMNDGDCLELGVKEMDRVRVTGDKSMIVLVSRSSTAVGKGEILIPKAVQSKIVIKDGDTVDVAHSPRPESVRVIRKKMDGKTLSKEEIYEVVNDIADSKLSKIEVSAWLTSLYINGMDVTEISNFTQAMVDTGDRIIFDRQPVFDFHSVGGAPGNKITPIVVSIVAAAGLMIPKTSSRAISSASGTSDFVETFCEVEMDAATLKEISERVGGVFAWGGAMNIAPVDDMVIKIEYPLGINPRAQMLASIMSKKVAIGATHLLVDIPTGAGTKVPTLEEGRAYVRDFTQLGQILGIHVECALTYADQPIGQAIGPKVEARECIRILEGHKHPSSVIEKACDLAGMILEMGGIPNGPAEARRILESGEAHKKFMEIVVAQKGSPDLKSTDLEPGEFRHDIVAVKSGFVQAVRNKDMVQIARAAGSPSDKGAGILIMKKKGQRVERGDVLMEIYADNAAKGERARDMALRLMPIIVEGMVIETSSGKVR